MHCRHCGSSDVRKFEVIYHEGTTVIGGNAASSGLSSVSAISPERVVQTESARRCAPPADPRRAVRLVAGSIAAVSVILWLQFVPHAFNGWIVDALLPLFVGIVMYLASSRLWMMSPQGYSDLERYDEACLRWRRSWQCSKCGEVTVQDAG